MTETRHKMTTVNALPNFNAVDQYCIDERGMKVQCKLRCMKFRYDSITFKSSFVGRVWVVVVALPLPFSLPRHQGCASLSKTKHGRQRKQTKSDDHHSDIRQDGIIVDGTPSARSTSTAS